MECSVEEGGKVIQLCNFANGIVLCYLGFIPYLSRLWYSRSYCFGLDFNSYRVFHYVLEFRMVALTLLTLTAFFSIVIYFVVFIATAFVYLVHLLKHLSHLDPIKCTSLTFYSGLLPVCIVMLVIAVSFVVWIGKSTYTAVRHSEREYLKYISRSVD